MLPSSQATARAGEAGTCSVGAAESALKATARAGEAGTCSIGAAESAP
jgi:hypothetical protein